MAASAEAGSALAVFEEILWDPSALPLARRVIDGIGVEVDPKVTGKILRACRSVQSDAQLRHLKRVSSQEAQEEYKSKLPEGALPPKEVVEVAGSRCDIPEGKIRILLGPSELWPDDQPEKSADSALVRAARRQVPILTEDTLHEQTRKVVSANGGTFVRFPFVAIPSSDPLGRSIESAYIWPMKPAQAPVPPSTGLLAEDPSVAEKMMEFAIEAAAIGRANGFRGCGAVVYDPMWKQMRGWAYDQTQYLGVPSTEAASASSSSSSASAGASAEPGWSERVHPLHTASLLVIEAIAVADRRRRGAFDRVREAKAGLNWDPASPSVTGQAARPPGAGTAVSEVRPPTLPPAAVRSSSAGAAASSSSPSDTSDATETTVPSTRHHAAATTTRKRERPNDTALQPKGTATSPSSATAAATGDDDDEEDANSVAVDGGVDGGADAETEAETEAPPSGKRSASRADAVVGAALSGRASKHLTPRSKGTYLYDVPVLALPDTEPVPSVPGDDQYICTGYDVFLSVEPSAMDAMALSHSRVRSVFFATPDATDGALVSRLRLHEAKALNHHYRVFQLDPSNRLTKQAAELWASPYGEGAGNPFRCDPARSASVRAFRAKGDQSEALE